MTEHEAYRAAINVVRQGPAESRASGAGDWSVPLSDEMLDDLHGFPPALAPISWPGREGNGDEADRILAAEMRAAGGASVTELFRDSLRRLAADVALSAARAQRLGLHGLAGDLRLAGTELGQMVRFASATEVA